MPNRDEDDEKEEWPEELDDQLDLGEVENTGVVKYCGAVQLIICPFEMCVISQFSVQNRQTILVLYVK